ncbi:MAG TPA: response regulator transcription factor [Hyphomicrobium sp.]|nr:response regulator transcription factor [Hyphomicrobium sp.]
MVTHRPGAVVIADDHSLYRRGLGYLLKDRLNFGVVIEAVSFDNALDLLADTPDVVLALFDLAMPGISGPESLAVVKETYPDLRVVIVTGSEDRRHVLAAVQTGLNGFVPKTLPEDDVVSALEGILDGRIYVPRFMTTPATTDLRSDAKSVNAEPTTKAVNTIGAKPISPRQRDVLECVRRGLSNKEIARELDIAEGTVKIHLAALFAHFGARNRTELATKS